jgi:hypothetical protein
LLISAAAIDYRMARGMREEGRDANHLSGFRVLFECQPLLVLAAALAFFHLGNGAMLPLVRDWPWSPHNTGHGNGAGFVPITIMVAQSRMIVVSLIGMQLAEWQVIGWCC